MCDVLVRVASVIFPADFVILDCEVDFGVPIILGRPFLATEWALVDMKTRQMKFLLNNEQVTFNICQSMKETNDMRVILIINIVDEDELVNPIKDRLGVEALAAVIMNFNSDNIDKYDEMASALVGRGL